MGTFTPCTLYMVTIIYIKFDNSTVYNYQEGQSERQTGIQKIWVLFNSLLYTFVPILVILRSIINRGDNLKEKQTDKKIWALPVKKCSFEFLHLICLFVCKKNFIPISIYFCVIALQSYREILKKYRKRAITLVKNIFSKI